MNEMFRTSQFRVTSIQKRIVEGPMVPFDVDTVIDSGLTERFTRSAFAHQYRAANRIWLRTAHRVEPHSHVIGAGIRLRDTDDGLYGEFRVVASERGDEWLAMASDETFSLEWSVGFTPLRWRVEDGVTVYTRAEAFEQAFVTAGAYGQAAKVAAVRAGTPKRLVDTLPPLPKLPPLAVR